MRWMSCFALGLVLSLASVAGAVGTEEEVIAEADRLYGLRADSGKAQDGLDLLRDGAQAHPQSYGIQWRIARACFWICDGTEDKDIKKSIGMEGWEAGDKAVALDASGIEGHYWTTLAMGEYSKGISIIKAIGKGIDKQFTHHLDTTLAADEAYDNGGALRAKGRYWFALPKIMRSFEKSLEKLERADELVPNHPRTLLYVAETQHAMGDDAAARTSLDAALACTGFPDAAERDRVMVWARAFDKELP
jgi:tetratricopeptide (TPR) repeat protein